MCRPRVLHFPLRFTPILSRLPQTVKPVVYFLAKESLEVVRIRLADNKAVAGRRCDATQQRPKEARDPRGPSQMRFKSIYAAFSLPLLNLYPQIRFEPSMMGLLFPRQQGASLEKHFLGHRHAHGHRRIHNLPNAYIAGDADQHVRLLCAQTLVPLQPGYHILERNLDRFF